MYPGFEKDISFLLINTYFLQIANYNIVQLSKMKYLLSLNNELKIAISRSGSLFT